MEKGELPERNTRQEPRGAGVGAADQNRPCCWVAARGQTAGGLLLTTHVPPLTLGPEVAFVTQLVSSGWGSPPVRSLQG